MFIYTRFEELRQAKGVTKTYIANALGRTPTICQDWKQGKSEPNSEQLEIVASILGTTPAYLTGETDEISAAPGPDEADIKAAFFGGYSDDLSQEEIDGYWKDAQDYIAFKIAQDKNGKKKR